MRCALFSTAVLVLLTGCASPGSTVPAFLLDDCVKPTVEVGTNAGLAKGLLQYDAALQSCNDDKAAIRNHLGLTK